MNNELLLLGFNLIIITFKKFRMRLDSYTNSKTKAIKGPVFGYCYGFSSRIC